MKQYFYSFSIALLFVCCHAKPVKPSGSQQEDTTGIAIHVYRDSSNGFGYRISKSGKDLIDQPNIPAVSQNKAFASKEEALRTARLVKQKIGQAIFPPAVSIKELDSMHIRY